MDDLLSNTRWKAIAIAPSTGFSSILIFCRSDRGRSPLLSRLAMRFSRSTGWRWAGASASRCMRSSFSLPAYARALASAQARCASFATRASRAAAARMTRHPCARRLETDRISRRECVAERAGWMNTACYVESRNRGLILSDLVNRIRIESRPPMPFYRAEENDLDFADDADFAPDDVPRAVVAVGGTMVTQGRGAGPA